MYSDEAEKLILFVDFKEILKPRYDARSLSEYRIGSKVHSWKRLFPKEIYSPGIQGRNGPSNNSEEC